METGTGSGRAGSAVIEVVVVCGRMMTGIAGKTGVQRSVPVTAVSGMHCVGQNRAQGNDKRQHARYGAFQA
jgi:hypothetical protein